MSAEGINISSISRLLEHSWSTINRWLEQARKAYHDFQIKHFKGYELREIQADDTKAFTHANKNKVWILTLIDVSTRLWPSVLTEFIEKLYLTIRRKTTYLHRKNPAHTHRPDKLQDRLELQQCCYNFMRLHLALKFGPEVYTSAMIKKIADRRITWAEVPQLCLAAIEKFLINCSDHVEDRSIISS